MAKRNGANEATAMITPDEAKRAIVDFEGLAGEAPVLMGWFYAEGKQARASRLVLRHDIFDATLQSALGHARFDGLHRYESEARSLGQCINDLARRAQRQDRRIVAWNQHELTTVAEAELSSGLLRLLRQNFRDGKATARRWRSRCHPDVVMPFETRGGANKLVRYFDLVGFAVPDAYGLGQTAKRIRQVRNGLERRGSFDQLVESQRGAWNGVLLHNAADCIGLREVVARAASELDAVPEIPAKPPRVGEKD